MDNLARAIELLPFIQVTRRQNPTTLVLGYSLSWKPELRKSAQISQGSDAARVLLGSIEVLGVRALRPPSSLRAGLLGGVSSASHCAAGRHRRTLGPVIGGQRWGHAYDRSSNTISCAGVAAAPLEGRCMGLPRYAGPPACCERRSRSGGEGDQSEQPAAALYAYADPAPAATGRRQRVWHRGAR
jgi:hypothetical protein